MPSDACPDDSAWSSPPSTGWRNRSSLGIGSASFFADAGHEIPTALLPSFLTSTLGAPAAALGLIEGIADALAGIGLATNVVQVGVLRAGAWTARGLRVPARNALLADAVAPEHYGRAYGYERHGQPRRDRRTTARARDGCCPRHAQRHPHLSRPRSAGCPGHRLRRPAAPRHTTANTRAAAPAGPTGACHAALRRLAPGITLFELGNVAATLLILRATELLTPGRGVDAATTTALSLYVAYNAAATVASFPADRATDRSGSLAVLLVGVVLFSVSYAGFASAGASVGLLAACFVAAGVAIGCVETAEHAAVAAHALEPIRGSAFGLLAGVQAFGNLIASSVAGALWTLASPTAAFAYATMLTAAACVAILPAARRARVR